VSSDQPLYEDIGRSYSKTRREDPRIAAEIHACLGRTGPVVNVGAGTGNYEPTDRPVIAVEPSLEMLRQRRGRTRHVVRGVAEALPFSNAAFATAIAVLTMHHWADPHAGLRELRRVSTRQVVFFFEPLHTHNFWALEYFPEAARVPSERNAPGEELLREVLRVREIRPVLVPHDCLDGFGAAFWARPTPTSTPRSSPECPGSPSSPSRRAHGDQNSSPTTSPPVLGTGVTGTSASSRSTTADIASR
jgi:SAM-dependent methyltransferase